MSIRTSDLIRLAKHFNRSHRYKGKQQPAPHHFKEQMKLVSTKAKKEMAEHRRNRKTNKEEK